MAIITENRITPIHDFLEEKSVSIKGILKKTEVDSKTEERNLKIVWHSSLKLAVLHLGAIYGFWLWLTVAKWETIVAAYGLMLFSGMGVTAGAHRLWCHRSYTAKWPLRFLLMIMNTMALQNDIFEWSRDHRVHHKHSETDADPHNANRGFFFAHVGWLMVRKHPDVIEKGSQLDMTDLWADPLVRFQRRFYIPLVTLICFYLPAAMPAYLWGENFYTAFFVCSLFRYALVLHITWLVNSAAHLFGHKQYDKSIGPAENMFVSLVSGGEGYHNYHHVFPWDYSTSELSWMRNFNFSTMFIDFFAWLGLVTDRKKVKPEIVKQRMDRTGEKLEFPYVGQTFVQKAQYHLLFTIFLWLPLLMRSIAYITL